VVWSCCSGGCGVLGVLWFVVVLCSCVVLHGCVVVCSCVMVCCVVVCGERVSRTQPK
jgi:hypothetical protein